MNRLEAALQAWADGIEKTLPLKCPKCACELDEVRYAHDRDVTYIHLTQVTHTFDYYTARCPACDHVLLRAKAEGVRV